MLITKMAACPRFQRDEHTVRSCHGTWSYVPSPSDPENVQWQIQAMEVLPTVHVHPVLAPCLYMCVWLLLLLLA